MTVIANDIISITRNSTINKFVIVRVFFDQEPEIMRFGLY